jgi:phage shock protein A
MFEDWKHAWRQAVENFQREVSGADAGTPLRLRAMERELISAGGALARLDEEIARTLRQASREREEEAVCRRREGLAREAGDGETVRVAQDFAARHQERAEVLERKARVLEEERALLARDVDGMRRTLDEAGVDTTANVGPGTAGRAAAEPSPDDRVFTRLEHDARERAADARLEELKRKMRG